MSRQIAIAMFLLAMVAGLILTVPGSGTADDSTFDLSAIRSIAVQSGGRLKPMDTLAREIVRLVTGKERFQGEDPVFTVLRWAAEPEKTNEEAVVEVRNLALKKELGLAPDRRWYSFHELVGSTGFQAMQERIRARSEAGAKLDPADQDASTMLSRLGALDELLGGHSLTIVPNPAGMKEPWACIADVETGKAAVDTEQSKVLAEAYRSMLGAMRAGDVRTFNRTASSLSAELRRAGPYPSQELLAQEIHYNRFHPFRAAWLVYLVAILIFLVPVKQSYQLGVVATWIGFALHGYGFYLRTLIGGRAPVTNMYESVVWAAFGAILFALVLGLRRKSAVLLIVANAAAVVALILADNLPAVLDPSIKPLAPVLRNNFWLTTHVITIMLGYAAFMLALGLGHVVLWKKLVGSEKPTRELDLVLYRTLQVGVLFLAAGTILGGVWANYSWGRFWGWDPKEVWALIALLLYLALLHGRYCGWVRSFEMAAGAVLGFLGVLMAWYGVNFVLGAGLHSYGFGNGGVGYVAAFAVAEMAFVGLAAWKHYGRGRSKAE
ncbi:MAG: cytochrome c biogenesis protein CcsA [Armatimonadetes bacterium]|nr:cytochrome c biogenesis protein CcsA [Armatimonadota bacterium]